MTRHVLETADFGQYRASLLLEPVR
jgi:hypothetical protein